MLERFFSGGTCVQVLRFQLIQYQISRFLWFFDLKTQVILWFLGKKRRQIHAQTIIHILLFFKYTHLIALG